MKKIVHIVFLLLSVGLSAQTQAPNQVINAAGEERRLGSSNITITDNVGEPFTQAIGSGNFLITQGFLQPDVISPGGFTVSLLSQDYKCIDKEEDAFISLDIVTPVKNYTTSYFWTPQSACPNNDCGKIDSIGAGFYSVAIVIAYKNNLGAVRTDTVKKSAFIANATEPCKVKIFSGVTPNDDGINEVFTIDDIKEFPKNSITIFNRWGLEVYKIQGYNNKDKSWPSKSDLSKLPSSTYFYIIDLGDGGKPIKGWVELIKD